FDFDLSGLDFPGSGKPGSSADLELDPTRPAANPSAASAASGLDLADLSLDSPGDSGGGEGVATKLELAKAYLEIGDKDGARDILQEVAKEGSSAQKEEAQKLIASL
ncbi:MAG: FimV/HubP family polar landmark protein, partial [Usitatibacter sp.]